MVQKIHPRGVNWAMSIRPKFDDSNLACVLRVRSIRKRIATLSAKLAFKEMSQTLFPTK